MKFLIKSLHTFDQKKDREYVSEADRFLHGFDKERPQLSVTQRQEIAKHKNIFNRKKGFKF